MNKKNSISTALAVVAGFLLSTNASAKEHKPKMSDQVKVIAHISFTGQTPVDMTMQKQGDDKYYLYIQQNNQAISVVDVGKPTRPKTVGEIADPSFLNAVKVTENLAIVTQSQMAGMSSANAQNDLVFWDLTNPTSPQVVQKFSGVVKWLQDERNFIYVLKNDGLWVMAQPEEEHQPDVMSVPLYQ